MGMGLPMVIACPRGEATKIIECSASGLVLPPEDPMALADCVASLYSDRERLAGLASASAGAAGAYDRSRQAALMLASLVKAART